MHCYEFLAPYCWHDIVLWHQGAFFSNQILLRILLCFYFHVDFSDTILLNDTSMIELTAQAQKSRDTIMPMSSLIYFYVNGRKHRWELPILRYHNIRVNYPYPFLGVISG